MNLTYPTMKSFPLSLAAAALVLLSSCSRHPESATAAEDGQPAVKVRLVQARMSEKPSLTEVVGTVRPANRAVLAAKLMGSIAEMPVTLGQRVRQGDLLVKLLAAEVSARLLQAQSQLNQAQRDVERERDLLKKGASTAEMVRSLEDRLALTQGLVREAEAMLGYTTLRAPFDGVISRKLANRGDLASPGMALLEIEGLDSLQIEAGIPDSLAGNLKLGDSLAVMGAPQDRALKASLVELSSATEPGARTVFAKLRLPPEATLRSGQFARVLVPGAPVRSLCVPAAAVARKGQLEVVFVRSEEGRAVLRLVKTGAQTNGEIEVFSGLSDGERVVVAPPVGLREGRRLEVAP